LSPRHDAFDVRSGSFKYISAFKKIKQTILRPKENPLWFDMRSRRYRIPAVNSAIAGTSASRPKKAGTHQKKIRFTGAPFNDTNDTIALLVQVRRNLPCLHSIGEFPRHRFKPPPLATVP